VGGRKGAAADRPRDTVRWTPGQTSTRLTLTLNGRPQAVPVPGGAGPGTTNCAIKLNLPRAFDADNLVEIRQRTSADHEHVLGYVSSPPPVRAKMYASCARQQLLLTLENPTNREQDYALALNLPAGLSWSAATPPTQVSVPAGQTREWRIGLAGIRALGMAGLDSGTITPAHGPAVRSSPRRRRRCPTRVSSIVLRRTGSSACRNSGTGRTRKACPADIPLSFLGIYVDTTRVHSGQQSLRFDPKRDSPKAGWPVCWPGRSGHRYKLSAWFLPGARRGFLLVQVSAGMVSISPQPTDPVGRWFNGRRS